MAYACVPTLYIAFEWANFCPDNKIFHGDFWKFWKIDPRIWPLWFAFQDALYLRLREDELVEVNLSLTPHSPGGVLARDIRVWLCSRALPTHYVENALGKFQTAIMQNQKYTQWWP